MYIEVLVDRQIEEGGILIEALHAKRVPITAAFWCRLPELEIWRLVIGSKLVSRVGSFKAYSQLHAILNQLSLSTIAFDNISLLSPDDPEYRRLKEHAGGPGNFGVRAATPQVLFQDAYIYPVKRAG